MQKQREHLGTKSQQNGGPVFGRSVCLSVWGGPGYAKKFGNLCIKAQTHGQNHQLQSCFRIANTKKCKLAKTRIKMGQIKFPSAQERTAAGYLFFSFFFSSPKHTEVYFHETQVDITVLRYGGDEKWIFPPLLEVWFGLKYFCPALYKRFAS